MIKICKVRDMEWERNRVVDVATVVVDREFLQNPALMFSVLGSQKDCAAIGRMFLEELYRDRGVHFSETLRMTMKQL